MRRRHPRAEGAAVIDQKTIEVWKANYGLDRDTPENAMRWWAEHMDGRAPVGAVAALGLALNELERLKGLLFSLGAMSDPPCFACGYNGPGYYQTSHHPCAARHHEAQQT
jgi:hypothetical protein